MSHLLARGTAKHITFRAVGTTLARELLSQGEPVTLVSRSGQTMPGADVATADLAVRTEVQNVVEE